MSAFPIHPTAAGDVPLLPRQPEPERPAELDVALVLRPLPGWNVPANQRLKRLLKAILRGYGFKVLGYSDIAPPAAQAGAGAAQKAAEGPGGTEAA